MGSNPIAYIILFSHPLHNNPAHYTMFDKVQYNYLVLLSSNLIHMYTPIIHQVSVRKTSSLQKHGFTDKKSFPASPNLQSARIGEVIYVLKYKHNKYIWDLN